MNRKGSLSIEALISCSVLLMLLVILVSLFSFLSVEDQMAQAVLDEAKSLEMDYYLIQKVGISDWSILQSIDQVLPEYVEEILGQRFSSYSELVTVESFMYLRLKYLLEDRGIVTSITIEDFEVEEDVLSFEIAYKQVLPLGIAVKNSIKLVYKMWYFGNAPYLYHQTTLGELIDEKADVFVYVTKTGSKYHTKDCFYIVRSSTDQKGVKKILLTEAKQGYAPCKRCILKEVSGWK
jgi:hypothetical protein